MKAVVQSVRRGIKQVSGMPWSQGGWQPLAGYGAGGSPAQMTRAINTYGGTEESSASVFACVVKIANELAGYPHELTDPNDKPILRTAATEDLFALLEEPQEETTYFDWVADVETDLELVGNSFWIEDNQNQLGQPERLNRLFPHQVMVHTDEQDKKDGYIVSIQGRMIPFGLEDILHFRTRNPLNRHVGMGTVEAIYREVNTDLAESQHVSSFFINGARIAGVLTVDENVDDATFERLKREVADQYGGPMNAYKTLIAAGASDYKPISQPPAAAGVIELRRLSQDAIYKSFGVPEFLLGGVAQGGVYKMSEAQYIFYRNMIPRARRFQERTTLSLTTRWEGTKFAVKPELNEPPEDKLRTAAQMLQVGGALNESREHAGLPRVDDTAANVPLVPQGLLPFGTVAVGEQLRQITSDPIQVPRHGTGRKELPAPPGGVAMPGKAPPPDGGDQVIEADVMVEQPLLPPGYELRSRIEPKTADPEIVQELVDAQAEWLILATPYIANTFRDFFTGQRQRILVAMGQQAREAAAELKVHHNGAAVVKRLSISAIWKVGEENRSLVDAFLAAIDQLGDVVLETARRVLGSSFAWDQQHRHIWAARDKVGKLIVRINEQTRAVIAREISIGVNRGYSVPQIANGNPQEGYGGIVGVFDQATGARAETIARTETAFLHNAATTAAYREDGVEHVEVLDGTEWDKRCREANRQVWTVKKAEANPLEHPNCTRAFAPVVESALSVSGLDVTDVSEAEWRLWEMAGLVEDELRDAEDRYLVVPGLDGGAEAKGISFDPHEHPRWPAGTPGGVAGQFRDDLSSTLAQDALPVIPTLEELRGAPASATPAQALQNGYAAKHIIESAPEVQEAQLRYHNAKQEREQVQQRFNELHTPSIRDYEAELSDRVSQGRDWYLEQHGVPEPVKPPEYEEYEKVSKEVDAANGRVAAEAANLASVRFAATTTMVEELRGTGLGSDTELDLKPAPMHGPGTAEMAPQNEQVAGEYRRSIAVMPREYIEQSNAFGPMYAMVGGHPAEYGPDHGPNNNIALMKAPIGADPSSHLHEFMHRIQHTNPQIRDMERKFHEYRTKGELGETRQPMAFLSGGGRGRPDKYASSYTGREYPDDRFGEVLTTGTEWAYGGSPHRDIDVWEEDPEHVAFTLGVLTRGALAPQDRPEMEHELGVGLAQALADLPSPEHDMSQSAKSFDQLALEGKQAQDDYEALLDLGQGIGDDFGAETHRLGSRTEFDSAAVKRAEEAVSERPERMHVLLVPHKGDERLKQKVELKYGGKVDQITDYIRGSILVPDPADIPRVVEQMKRHAEERGFKVGPIENKYVKIDGEPHSTGPQGEYRDLAVLIQAPNGHVCELQVLTTEMWRGKEVKGTHPDHPDDSGHTIYEQFRVLAERRKRGEELNEEAQAELERLAAIQDAIFAGAWQRAIDLANEIRKGKRR